MQPQTSTNAPTPSEPFRPPSVPGSKGSNLATMLAVVAIVLALVAVAMNFVVPGPSGSAGTNANSTTTLWAVVTTGGALSRGSGANYSTHPAAGQYEVYFYQILYGCTFSAGIGQTGTGVAGPNIITVAADPASVYGVKVSITNITTHDANNSSFHLLATCPAGLSASVLANGTFVSGAGVVSTAYVGGPGYPGSYQVIFNTDVSGCAYNAGLGIAGQGSAPSGSVTTASRSGNVDGVFIATFDPARTLTNESFHLTVYC